MEQGSSVDAREGFVVLDPSVHIEELSARKAIWSQGPAVRRGWLLVHDALETAAVVPPGGGLGEFLAELRAPVRLAELVEADEVGTEAVAWQLIEGLLARGFAHRWPHARTPDEPELAELRAGWRARCRHARRWVTIDASKDPADPLIQRLAALVPAPSLAIRVHGGEAEQGFLARLAAGFQRGAYAAHEVVIEQVTPQPLTAAARAAVRRLGASVRLRARADLGDLDLAQVGALVAEHIPVIARLQAAADGLTADTVATITHTLASAHVTAVELELDWTGGAVEAAADSATASAALADQAVAICTQVEALLDALGDVEIVGFPSDDELCQGVLSERAPPGSALERATRALHLRRRASYLLEMEGKTVWGQDPEAEELSVPSEDDLLPNHPALLGLREGAIVADVAGGFGRVARRLAPHVGATGTIISIEKEAITLARARRYAAQLGAVTLQFRVGLGQRLPMPDASVDAAVMEWGGEIHREGLLGRCVAEMRRVVRPGGRIAITYRLSNILLENLTESLAPYPQIYPAILEAVQLDGLTIVAQKFWAMQTRMSEAPLASVEERYLPRLVDDFRHRKVPRQPPNVDLTLTLIVAKAP